MAKLKKTLPKNLIDLVEHKDWETLKKELLKCDPMAYEHFRNWRGSRAEHILYAAYCMSYKNWYCLSAEMVEWIIDNNNFDFDESFWDKLLTFYIERKQTEIVEVLLKKGFDPNRNNALNFALKMGSQHYRDIVNPEIVELLLQYGAKVQKSPNDYSEPLYTLLNNILTFTTYIFDIKYFNRLLDNFPDYLKMIELLISYGKKSNLDIKHPKLQEAVEQIRQKFYEEVYTNPELKKHYSESELESKLNQLEQFELKLYELMQFEPA